jgi:hypothetical protein
MKRYLVFCFDDYYPSGGWNDLHGEFDDIGAAFADADNWPYENTQVIDTETGKEIKQ